MFVEYCKHSNARLMKRLFTLILGLALASTGFSQLSLSETVINLDLGAYLDYEEVFLTNNGSETIEFAIGLDVRCYDPADGMQLQLCFGDQCFEFTNQDDTWGETSETPLVTLAPGETTGQISIHQFFVGTVGSEWTVIFFDRNNPDTSVELEVLVDVCDQANSVSEIAPATFETGKAYPSPANASVSIPYTTNVSNASMVLTDLVGSQVKQVTLDGNSGEVRMEVSDLPNGVYFYRILGDGERSAVRSLVVSH